MLESIARPVRFPWPIAIAAWLALIGLFVLGFDQGQTSPLSRAITLTR